MLDSPGPVGAQRTAKGAQRTGQNCALHIAMCNMASSTAPQFRKSLDWDNVSKVAEANSRASIRRRLDFGGRQNLLRRRQQHVPKSLCLTDGADELHQREAGSEAAAMVEYVNPLTRPPFAIATSSRQRDAHNYIWPQNDLVSALVGHYKWFMLLATSSLPSAECRMLVILCVSANDL
jgi:hypothetical protein